MATIGQVIFRIMIVIIIILVAAIALIIGLSVAGSRTTIDVTTVNAVGQIGEDAVLNCIFTADVKQSSNILWEKVGVTGVVYRYENGKASLTDQNPNFKSRTSLFLDQLSVGNASLKINNVQMSDAGVYKCTITNSKGKGENKLRLDVGAFTALTMTVTVKNISQITLHCNSPSWYPKPTVSWLNASSGSVLTNFNTTYVPGLSRMVEVISDLYEVEKDMQYRCVIQNELARAEGDAIFTDSGLKQKTRVMVLNSAQIMLSPSRLLLCLLVLIFLLGAEDI